LDINLKAISLLMSVKHSTLQIETAKRGVKRIVAISMSSYEIASVTYC
jgi:hypothetical protein